MSEPGDRLSRPFVDEIMVNQEAADCLQPMGQTSENVGKDFNITREMQDRYAAESYRRAEVAQKSGWFDDEIVPIQAKVKDPKTGEEKTVTLTKDEGPRHGTTYEALAKIRPAFSQFGDKSTGGNSSQVTDGGAAVLLMKRSMAESLGQPILAKFVGATVAGLPPRIMGIGPSVAVPKLLKQYNLTIDDIDLVELNEAFASMAVYCLNFLKIDHSKMNVRGGAIALGHPLGATGARQIVTGLSECRRQKKRILLTVSDASIDNFTEDSPANLDLSRLCALVLAKVWLVCSSTSSYKQQDIKMGESVHSVMTNLGVSHESRPSSRCERTGYHCEQNLYEIATTLLLKFRRSLSSATSFPKRLESLVHLTITSNNTRAVVLFCRPFLFDLAAGCEHKVFHDTPTCFPCYNQSMSARDLKNCLDVFDQY